jgi:hypothetical protein
MEGQKKALAVDAIHRVNRNSLSDEIVEQIIDLISRGVLKPGERLPSEGTLFAVSGRPHDDPARPCAPWP